MNRFTTSSPALRRVLALATLAIAGGSAWAMGPGEHRMDAPYRGFGGPGMGRLLEQVGTTPEQRSQIEQIMKAAHEDLHARRQAGRSLQTQMRELFTQPTVDAAAVEALRQQMLAQHDAASQRMTQAMLDVSTVLSVEQRQALAAQMARRAERMREHPPRRGAEGGRPGA